MKFLLILIAKTKISLLLLLLLLLRAMRVSMPTSVSASGHAHAQLQLYVCGSVCAERASAPSFGHSDADKCCTRIPNTFLSLAAAAVARANVNAATARSCCTVPHVVGPLRERERGGRGRLAERGVQRIPLASYTCIQSQSPSPRSRRHLLCQLLVFRRKSYKRFLTIINNWIINNQFERVIWYSTCMRDLHTDRMDNLINKSLIFYILNK